jgi:hypothetical protein
LKSLLNKLRVSLIALFLLTACTSDMEPTSPSFSFLLNGEGLSASEVNMLEPGMKYVIEYQVDKGSEESIEFAIFLEKEQLSTQVFSKQETNGRDTLLMPTEAGSYKLYFEIKDAGGKLIYEEAYDLEVVDPTPTVNEYSLLLIAPHSDLNSKSVYSSNKQKNYSIHEINNTSEVVSSDIDFGYAFEPNNGKATLVGISDYPHFVAEGSYKEKIDEWEVRNRTIFRRSTMTTDEFDAIKPYEDEKILKEFVAGSGLEGTVSNIQTGYVIAFRVKVQSPDTRYGLLKVDKIEEGIGNEGQIEFTIKILNYTY